MFVSMNERVDRVRERKLERVRESERERETEN